MHATYNLHTNKIKFYPPAERLTPDQDKERRACNFVWYPGQKCFAAAWSPSAVAFVESFGIEIEADDTPDNVEARAERFAKYAEGAEQASESAANYAAVATTEKRTERALSRAASEAERAEYWTSRIASAIRHAEYKDRPDVIARRIKGLEADLRKQTAEHEGSARWLARWQNVTPGDYDTAVKLANYGSFYVDAPTEDQPTRQTSTWNALTSNQITPAEARAAAMEHFTRRMEYARQWIEHLNTRIEFERAYLEAVAGEETAKALFEKKPRRVAKAPDDGIKKGSIVRYRLVSWKEDTETQGTVLSVGAHYLRVTVPPEFDKFGYYKDGMKVMRKSCVKVTA